MEKAMPKEIYALLDKLNIKYASVSHPAAMTMEDLQSVEVTLGAPFCKNLFLCNRQKTEHFLLLIREDKRFRTAEVSKKIDHSRLSFGDEDKLFEYLGCHGGAITPMGLVFDGEQDVRLLIDRDLLACEKLCVHPCVNTESLAISGKDLFEKYIPYTKHVPTVIDITGEAE